MTTIKKMPKKRPRPAAGKLAQLVEQLNAAKRAAEKAAEQAAYLQEQVLQEMIDTGIKTDDLVLSDGSKAKITLVQGTTLVLDEERLKKAVGSQMWNKVTVRKVDKRKMDAFIKTGEIDPQTVAEVSEIKSNRPYVRVTNKPG